MSDMIMLCLWYTDINTYLTYFGNTTRRLDKDCHVMSVKFRANFVRFVHCLSVDSLSNSDRGLRERFRNVSNGNPSSIANTCKIKDTLT